MPLDPKPLFRPEALRSHLATFELPSTTALARTKLNHWSILLGTPKAGTLKETELRDEFIYDVFRDLLGYVSAVQDSSAFTLKKEKLIEVDGTFADAAFGKFDEWNGPTAIVLEGKGPGDPLDKPYRNRNRSAVVQAMLYAVQLQIDWYLVTNLRETRLYHKGHDTGTFERFLTERLSHDENELKRFVFLLGAERVVRADGKNHLDGLLTESKRVGRTLTGTYYREYRELRARTFEALRSNNPDKAPVDLLAVAQKILDRVLFIAFCEKRELLPREIIARAYQHSDPFNPRPIWENFKGLFRAVDTGNPALKIDAYNGGLYETDPFIDSLVVPDEVCVGFRKLAEYEYGNAYKPGAKIIDVEILGHIFEQSISDLEELHRQLTQPELTPAGAGPSKRKKEGAFYTPEFITRYIVTETLGTILRFRFERLRTGHEEDAAKTARKALADPRTFDPDKITEPQRKALATFWKKWMDELETIRIVDPACGSGAFLIEVFDQMFAAYEEAQSFLRDLEGPSLFDVRKTILTQNLFGMDLNGEAVEIARLSCWIKTAEAGKKLTALDKNIRRGNSVMGNPTPLDFWKAEFPGPMNAGGFDVVIGNPPYVRQEWIAPFKPHWKATFESFNSVADLFVYFYELGVKLLRPGGRMGYITSGSWVRGNFGEQLRGFLARKAGLESVIDFGEYQPFEDAEMIRPSITILSKRPAGGPMRLFKWLTSGKPPENLSDIISAAPTMRTDHLGSNAWELESDEVIALKNKLASGGRRLEKYVSGDIYRGVLSGLTEAFVIDGKARQELIAADNRSAELIKPFVQGTNLRPWYVSESGDYLICIKSSDNLGHPWANSGEKAEGEFAECYPAIHAHLNNFRQAAIKRSDQGRFWWELRSCDYWQQFEKPKIVWPDITNRPRFSMELEKRYLGNTGYIIPLEDYFLLGVLSSWATWFFISKTAQPLRLRSDRWQYRLIAQFMVNVPIPSPPVSERKAIASLAERCCELGNQRYQIETAVQHRLLQAFGTDASGQTPVRLNEKALEWWEQSFPVLALALQQSFKLPRSPFANPKTADEWEPYLASKLAEVTGLRKQLDDAEREINDRVYQLFALTPDEIKLLQREVEH